MIKRILLVVLVLLAILTTTGCFNLEIKDNVSNPARAFNKAMATIKTIHAENPGRKGEVKNLNILAYIGGENKLISVSIPKALAQIAPQWKSEIKSDKTFGKYSYQIDQIDLEKFKDLDKLGPGMLMETKIDEGKIRILIWLD
jgi:hypothetical protein